MTRVPRHRVIRAPKENHMNRHLTHSLTIAFTSLALFSSGIANADEASFLKSLSGNWSGKGTVKVRVNAPTINVTCRFKSDTTAASLSLGGKCTSLAIFSRAISADLKANGSRYSGSYVGAGTGTAGLGGQRAGDTISLGITWAKEVNGDRKAQMTIEKVGASGMRLTTIDTDPKTGKPVITSRIDLRRI